MVSLRPGRRGASALGCLVMLLFAAAAYYGVHVGDDLLALLPAAGRHAAAGQLRRVFHRRRHPRGTWPPRPTRCWARRPGSRSTAAAADRITIDHRIHRERWTSPLLKRTFVLRPHAEEPF